MDGLNIKDFLAREGDRLGIRKQEELAEVLGVTDQTVSNWVKGKTFPTHQTEGVLLKMGMTVCELFGEEIWDVVKKRLSAERSKDDFDRKSDFFIKKLFDKIDKLEPRG